MHVVALPRKLFQLVQCFKLVKDGLKYPFLEWYRSKYLPIQPYRSRHSLVGKSRAEVLEVMVLTKYGGLEQIQRFKNLPDDIWKYFILPVILGPGDKPAFGYDL